MSGFNEINNLNEFSQYIQQAKPIASTGREGRFTIGNADETVYYSQLIEKFNSLLAKDPTDNEKKLASRVIKDLTKLAAVGENLRYARICHGGVLDPLLRILLKRNPIGALNLTMSSSLIKQKAEDDGIYNEIKENAKKVDTYEKTTGLPYDPRFTIEQHEATPSLIFERRLADWVETGGAAENRKNREIAAAHFRTAYNTDEPRKKVAETHILILVPETVNGKKLSLNTFRGLVKEPRMGNATKYYYYPDAIENEHGTIPPEGGTHWVLMTKDVIPGSKGQLFAKQQALVNEEPQYEVPDLLSATVGILTHYVRTGECLFSYDATYIHCRETAGDGDHHVTVGGLNKRGLSITYYASAIYGYIGVAALRKFRPRGWFW